MSELILDICRKYFDEISHVDLIRNIPPKEIGCAEFWQKMGPVLTCYAYTPENTSWNEGLENGFEFGFAAGVYLSKSIQRSQVMTSKSDTVIVGVDWASEPDVTAYKHSCGRLEVFPAPMPSLITCSKCGEFYSPKDYLTRALSTNGESE